MEQDLQKKIEELTKENEELRQIIDQYERSDLFKLLNTTYNTVEHTIKRQKELEQRFNEYELRLQEFRKSINK